jgi:hypothetical protein
MEKGTRFFRVPSSSFQASTSTTEALADNLVDQNVPCEPWP